MNRRQFLEFLALGTGALALNKRVWSFPIGKIRLANIAETIAVTQTSYEIYLHEGIKLFNSEPRMNAKISGLEVPYEYDIPEELKLGRPYMVTLNTIE